MGVLSLAWAVNTVNYSMWDDFQCFLKADEAVEDVASYSIWRWEQASKVYKHYFDLHSGLLQQSVGKD